MMQDEAQSSATTTTTASIARGGGRGGSSSHGSSKGALANKRLLDLIKGNQDLDLPVVDRRRKQPDRFTG